MRACIEIVRRWPKQCVNFHDIAPQNTNECVEQLFTRDDACIAHKVVACGDPAEGHRKESSPHEVNGQIVPHAPLQCGAVMWVAA